MLMLIAVSINTNPGTPQGTPSEKKTSILGTITGGKIKKRSGLLGIFGQNKVNIKSIIKVYLLQNYAIINV